ncbi:MAG: MBL fold metallo-hydrolase [Acidimicrobiales bacterium]
MSALVTGKAEAIAPLVLRVLAPNPGMMTGPGTNTYLVGGKELAVIDPGPEDASHLDALVESGGGRIRWILVTHTHPDHSPGAAALAARTGAQLLGFDARDGFAPDVAIGEGHRLETSEFGLRAVHTPGHASNHLCYLLEGACLLFSGDHVMGGSTVVISPPDGDMALYMASLERLLHLGLSAIAPGHGSVIEDPEPAVSQYLSHRRAREAAVLAHLELGPATIGEIVAKLYVDVAAELHPVARCSIWAHLRKLASEGLVALEGGGDGNGGRGEREDRDGTGEAPRGRWVRR